MKTFSPVIRFSNLRLLLGMTAELNLEVGHLDVEAAFFSGDCFRLNSLNFTTVV